MLCNRVAACQDGNSLAAAKDETRNKFCIEGSEPAIIFCDFPVKQPSFPIGGCSSTLATLAAKAGGASGHDSWTMSAG